MMGVGDALRADPRVFVYGEDVGGKYGNAFLLLKPLLEEFGDRIVNSPLAEGAVLGVCVGAALAGQRPIGEMQFNDFVATGFNQLVNNAAKIRYRWGGVGADGRAHAVGRPAPRGAVPFAEHGGLVLPDARPEDRRPLDAVRRARAHRLRGRRSGPGPLLRAHRALPRPADQAGARETRRPTPIPIGKAALRREGNDLAIVSYGAYVHVAMRVAEKLAKDGIEATVLDLRTLAPLDRGALLALARHCGRVLIVHEDTRTGSASARASPRSSRRKPSSISTLRCESSARSTRLSPTRPRSKSSSSPPRTKSRRPLACSPLISRRNQVSCHPERSEGSAPIRADPSSLRSSG